MTQFAIRNHITSATKTSAPTGPILQRKCACGAKAKAGGKCAEYGENKKEEILQRKATSDYVSDEVPPIVYDVLRSPGQPLDTATRAIFEPLFKHDFSTVRVHSDSRAAKSADAVEATAYAIGRDIVFSQGSFEMGSSTGVALMAHELAHVQQQNSTKAEGIVSIGPVDSVEEAQANAVADHFVGPRSIFPSCNTVRSPFMLQAKPKAAAQNNNQQSTPQICGRPSRKIQGNFIRSISLDVGANTLAIDWNIQSSTLPTSQGRISPGSGLCCVDCNDDTVSRTPETFCTPKGGPFTVSGTACALGGNPKAKNPTYFQRSGIAIHFGDTSSPPQSHGCARTSLELSEIIHDNVLTGTTQIQSAGTWSSKTCYLKPSSKNLSQRSTACDGLKKTQQKRRGKPKSASSEINAKFLETLLASTSLSQSDSLSETDEVTPDVSEVDVDSGVIEEDIA